MRTLLLPRLNAWLTRLFSGECVVHGPQLAVFEIRELPGSGSDLLLEFFATDLYFLFCDDVDNSPRERGPFLFELFYGLVRNELYRPLILRSLAPHPMQPNGQFARHRHLATKPRRD
jgi:hypothetical protein